jgi:hypothetical protein
VRSLRFDEGTDAFSFVSGEVVHDDHLARLELRTKEVLYVGLEGFCVGWVWGCPGLRHRRPSLSSPSNTRSSGQHRIPSFVVQSALGAEHPLEAHVVGTVITD